MVTHQSSISQTVPFSFILTNPTPKNTTKEKKKKKKRYITETSSFPCSESETVTEIMDSNHSINLSERLAQTTKLFDIVLVLLITIWTWIPVVLFKATVLVLCILFIYLFFLRVLNERDVFGSC